MSEEKKNLKYYLDHPDEMPEDPKELERLTQEHMQAAMESDSQQLTVDRFVAPEDKDEKKGAPSDAKVEDPKEAEAKAAADKAAADAKAATEAAAAEAATAAEAAKVAEVKPAGILAKDGKNVIPYGQLESARSRASAAEALVKQQAEEIAALKAAKPEAPAVDVALLSAEELEVLEADSPTLAKTLRAQQAAITELRGTVEALAQRQQNQAATEESVVKTEIQSAIDANPTLASWQAAEDQSMWNEASKLDKVLRESPKYADVPFAERFAKVVELTQSALGLEEPAPAVVVEQPKLTDAEIKAAAAAKLAEKAKASRPVSLSQIPGGAPPAVDEKEKVEQMSTVALGQQFLGMTREQMDAYLASL